MKKVLIIAVAACFIGTAAHAQDVLKQTGGEKNLELGFTPLGGNPVALQGGFIKVRSFTSATSAYRLSAFLGFSSEKTTIDGVGYANDDFTEITNAMKTSTTFNIGLAPGIEKHFVGTDRLSPYVGADLPIGFMSESSREEALNADSDGFVDGMSMSTGSFYVGLRALAGVDFYIADNLYLGTEFGFGLLFTSQFAEKSQANADADEVSSKPQGSSFDIGPQVLGQIRLGWLF